MDVQFFGSTDVGCKRKLNEDFFKISHLIKLTVVCDGMGGHESGDVASRIVAETMTDVFSRMTERQLQILSESLSKDIPSIAQRLYFSAQLANTRLIKTVKESNVKKGMGTTLVAVHFFLGNAIVLHVGDSRCYRIRNGVMNCLTRDHSLVRSLIEQGEMTEEEFDGFDQKNVITQALGMSRTIRMDLLVDKVEDNDVFLLCSDGLWGKVPDDRILERVNSYFDHLGELPAKLIQDAKNAGGDDNITVVVAKCDRIGTTQKPLLPYKDTLSMVSVIEEKQYRSVLRELFKRKLRLLWIIALIGTILFLIAVVSFFNLGPSKQEQRIENPIMKPERKPRQRVYFIPAEDPLWNSGMIFVDGMYCGTLVELGNGHFFELGKHYYKLKLGSAVVDSGEFECVLDPTGQRNLVHIGSR